MGLYKRGGVWWMRLTVGGRAVRRTTGTKDRRLAEKIEGKVKTEIVEGRWFDVLEERTRTVGEMIDRYIETHIGDRPHRSRYEAQGRALKRYLGILTLAEVTPKVLVEYKARRRKEGTTYTREGKTGEVTAHRDVGPGTINRELTLLSAAFNMAVKEWEWCRENPVARVSKEKEPPGRDRYLTAEEDKELFKACPDWLREIISFAVNTGMRQGEILSLRWPSVDLFRRVLVAEKSKNGEKRTVPLNEAVLTLFKEKARVRSLKTDLVFHSEAHTPIDLGNLRRAFGKAIKKAKVGDFHFHDLRHTFATRLVQAGVDMYKVQRLLGHKTPTMTQRYAHHSTESLRDGVEVLDRVRLLLDTAQNPAQTVPVKISVSS
ncbi:MAG: hypothetical protein A2V83_11140 [Nitrospirae bacterium RBG_16_64_22]|nr:MAG: hypothetical protein A2V83_11140 [Nitrospirae bacterium RBG_16_64_22]